MNNEISSLHEDVFSPKQHYGPVTAIKIFGQYIICGYGPILKLYDHNAQKFVYEKQIFKYRKIHSIEVSPNGEKLILSGEKSYAILKINDLLKGIEDIIEKCLNEWIITSCFLDDSTIVLLNAYNNVYKINIPTYDQEIIHCDEKSILYSGSINIVNGDEVYIAAGTIMDGVIIWNLKNKSVLHNLKHHEGSIFGVKIDSHGKYIISCSDDRSIKLFEFKTGELLSTGWGHGSRIWGLSFFKSTKQLKIMSIGEDCTLRIWNYEPGNTLLNQLRLYENCHRGKHIWSGDVDDLELKICATGGADGKLRIHDLDENHKFTDKYSLEIISQICEFNLIKNEFVRDFYEVSNHVIILTSNGHLVKFEKRKFSYIGHFKNLRDFGIVKGFRKLNIVVIADRNGEILIINDGMDHIKQTSLRISNMFTYTDNKTYYILLDCPNPNSPYILYKFNEGFQLTQTKLIQKPEKFITASSIAIDTINNWLFIATKKATIGVIDLETDETFVYRRVSEGDTISQVSIIESRTDSTDLLILARDGAYSYARFSKQGLKIYHQNKLSRGYIEGGYIQDNDLVLYGFKSSYFYVWNESKQIEIMNEFCGGNGHRLYKFIRSGNKFKFIYNFKNLLCICQFENRYNNYGLINPGTHGREIRDLSINQNTKLVAIIAEDSTISLNKIIDNEIKHYWTMNNHISGMQKIKFFNDEYLGSSAANEEFIIWKLNEMKGIPTICEVARLEKTKDVPDLRIMDFSSIDLGNGEFIIVTVYSDSQIKLWNFKDKFTLLSKWVYTTCCILNVQFFNIGDATYLLIATTDGFITIYNVTNFDDHSTVLKVSLHQSSIKAVSLYQIDNYYILITGGDDNAITVNKLSHDKSLTIDLVAREDNAASSTITSISKVSDWEFVVTSVDQIVRLWNFKDGLVCKAAKFTTVADTGCGDFTEIDDRKLMVIGGAGLSLWQFIN